MTRRAGGARRPTPEEISDVDQRSVASRRARTRRAAKGDALEAAVRKKHVGTAAARRLTRGGGRCGGECAGDGLSRVARTRSPIAASALALCPRTCEGTVLDRWIAEDRTFARQLLGHCPRLPPGDAAAARRPPPVHTLIPKAAAPARCPRVMLTRGAPAASRRTRGSRLGRRQGRAAARLRRLRLAAGRAVRRLEDRAPRGRWAR